MIEENCEFTEGMMVLVFELPRRAHTRGLIIEVYPLLQVADILLVDGTLKKRIPFPNIRIFNEDVI